MKLATVCLGFCLFSSLLLQHSAAQSCVSETLDKEYSKCNNLPYLSASLHWTYYTNGTIDVAYRAQQTSSGWVAWAINPTGTQMPGANAFLAFHNTSGQLTIFTTKFASTQVATSDIKDEDLSFTVHNRSVQYSSGYYTIYATLDLPNNNTKQNTVWQSSTTLSSGVPYNHPFSGDNVLSTTTIDFLSGDATSGGNSKLHRKNTHGVLCAISWGILMPIGAIIARYLKVFQSADPAWFYLHIACQCSAYIIGLSGWILGLKLGSESSGVTYNSHRNIGITLFSFATVQMLALFLRPNKDHKHRIYWNIYHRSFAITILILSIVNIFKGFDILKPADKWKHAYIAIIATLAGIAVLLEIVTCIIKIKRKKAEKAHYGANGTNGFA